MFVSGCICACVSVCQCVFDSLSESVCEQPPVRRSQLLVRDVSARFLFSLVFRKEETKLAATAPHPSPRISPPLLFPLLCSSEHQCEADRQTFREISENQLIHLHFMRDVV